MMRFFLIVLLVVFVWLLLLLDLLIKQKPQSLLGKTTSHLTEDVLEMVQTTNDFCWGFALGLCKTSWRKVRDRGCFSIP